MNNSYHFQDIFYSKSFFFVNCHFLIICLCVKLSCSPHLHSPLTLWGHRFLPQIPHATETSVGSNLGTTNQIGLIGAPTSVPMFLNSVSGGIRGAETICQEATGYWIVTGTRTNFLYSRLITIIIKNVRRVVFWFCLINSSLQFPPFQNSVHCIVHDITSPKKFF